MFNTYVLNYDPAMTDPTPPRLIEFVRSNSFTYQYLIPFAGTILIKSSASLIQLIDSYRPFFYPNHFILVQIETVAISGLLPANQWEWINASLPPPLLPRIN